MLLFLLVCQWQITFFSIYPRTNLAEEVSESLVWKLGQFPDFCGKFEFLTLLGEF